MVLIGRQPDTVSELLTDAVSPPWISFHSFHSFPSFPLSPSPQPNRVCRKILYEQTVCLDEQTACLYEQTVCLYEQTV